MGRGSAIRLGDRLVRDGLIDHDQLKRALDRQSRSGGFLGEILIAEGVVSLQKIRPHLEEMTGFPVVDMGEEDVDRKVAACVPESFAFEKLAMPFREAEGKVFVAMADPLNLRTVDEMKGYIRAPFVTCLAFAPDLMDAIRRTFDVRYKTESLLQNITVAQDQNDRADSELLSEAEDAPIVRLVNNILSGAIATSASDIHIEPLEENVRVRYRIDGALYEQMTMPLSHLPATISRLKVMSGMDISERRRPQDARFTTREENGREFDARVSTMPTAYGEKICVRLLEKSSSIARIDRIGLLPEQRTMFERFLKRPYGLILVTGPTGAGKTTTLYAGLQWINDPMLNISTIEDPVEYKISGINQMQVNPKIGLTFANGLRNLVRQDPDVILVGEIRDRETAEIAVQAALTGHLVLSTLHTNDSAGALVRLQNMGVERFLISSAVVGVMGQRLMRKVCPNCARPYAPHMDEALALGLPLKDGEPPVLAKGAGCRKCGGRGTMGRTIAAEMFPMNDLLRDAVLRGESSVELARLATQGGMATMREIGLRKVIDRIVPPEEIVRVFAREE